MELEEGFEDVPNEGASISEYNTSFDVVTPEDQYGLNLIESTADSWAGTYAARIPPFALGNLGLQRASQKMIWAHAGDNIINADGGLSFYYKYESDSKRQMGRFFFEVWFDTIGNPVWDENANRPIHDPETALFVGVEHSYHDPDDYQWDMPDGMRFHTTNINNLYQDYNSPEISLITPPMEQGVWHSFFLAWGDGGGMTLTIANEITQEIFYQEYRQIPPGLGFAWASLNPMADSGLTEDGENTTGLFFQNWFDGGGAPVNPEPVDEVAAETVGQVRRRFV